MSERFLRNLTPRSYVELTAKAPTEVVDAVQSYAMDDAEKMYWLITYLSLIGLLWPPYVIGGHYIFALWFVSFFLLFSSPNLSGRTLDVYRTSTHGVALVRI